jgi:GNAT superfamily N-acetyltransferase
MSGIPREIYETHRAGFTFSTNPARLDRKVIHDFLSRRSYWAQDIPEEIVGRSIDNSFCFGIYEGDKQVGFARVITDFATFGYLADVFVLETHRGRGLSKELVNFITKCPALQCLRRWHLVTQDAQTLYERFGFKRVAAPERHMEISRPDLYKKMKQIKESGE